MMADGVEADMSFRDVETLEISRREMVDDTMRRTIINLDSHVYLVVP